MPRFSPSAAGTAREMAGIAAAPQQCGQADELLALLGRVVPHQAAWLALLDDRYRRYAELASVGYDDRLRDYFCGTPMLDQVELVGMTSSPVPQRRRDVPPPLRELPVWLEYYLPAGFREGMAVGLFTQDGRHLGVLLVSTDTTDHPSDAERDLLGVLAPRIAAAVDPMRSLAALARVVHDAQAGAVLTSCGDVLRLPGLPGHALLAPGSTLLGVALRQVVHATSSVSFVWPVQAGSGGADDREGFIRVTVLGCVTAPPKAVGVVVLSPLPGGRSVLTRRELMVAGLLLEGWCEGRIGVAMDLPACAVAEIAERVTARLGAPDRQTALVRAARHGWFIPPQRAGQPT